MISRAVDFFNDEIYELRDAELLRVDAPTDARPCSVHHDWLLIELRTDWDGHRRPGPCWRPATLNSSRAQMQLTVVFEPDAHTSLHQLFVDPGQARRGHPRRRRQPRADLHPGRVDGHRPARGTAEHQHGDRRRGLARRRDLPGFKRFRHPVTAAARTRWTARSPEIKQAPVSSTPTVSRSSPAFRHLGRRHPDPVLRGRSRPGATPARPCWAVTAASRSSRTPGYDGVLGRLWLARGGTTCWPASAAAVRYGPAGTPGRCARAATS